MKKEDIQKIILLIVELFPMVNVLVLYQITIKAILISDVVHTHTHTEYIYIYIYIYGRFSR